MLRAVAALREFDYLHGVDPFGGFPSGKDENSRALRQKLAERSSLRGDTRLRQERRAARCPGHGLDVGGRHVRLIGGYGGIRLEPGVSGARDEPLVGPLL